jgi:NAD(P)-dependent dehydrogenase (short-subunit alcohol dehydrogenase family)
MASFSVSTRPRALITGASSGIGAAFAQHLAREGHDLVLLARRRNRLEELAERLRLDPGVQVEVICADLTDAEEFAKAEARIAGDGIIDLLVNNAGFGGYQPFASLEPRTVDNLIDIHVRAVTRLTRAVLPGMIGRGKGGIINISSLLALSGTLPCHLRRREGLYAHLYPSDRRRAERHGRRSSSLLAGAGQHRIPYLAGYRHQQMAANDERGRHREGLVGGTGARRSRVHPCPR